MKYTLPVLVLIILSGFFLRGKIPHEKFNSEKWKNWVESEAELSLRWDMMSSLRNKHELKGMSQPEIIELLGEPASKSQTEFGYPLGYSKHGINTGRLTIRFGEDGRVENFSVSDG